MKRLTALLATLLIGTSAHAAPPSTASVDELLSVTRSEKLLASVQQNLDTAVRNAMAQSLQDKSLTPRGQKVMDNFMHEYMGIMKEELSWDRFKDTYARIYSETFTQEEVDGLLAFYRSPAGQAMIDKMPLVMQKSMALTQERMGPLVQRLQAALKKATEEAQAAR